MISQNSYCIAYGNKHWSTERVFYRISKTATTYLDAIERAQWGGCNEYLLDIFTQHMQEKKGHVEYGWGVEFMSETSPSWNCWPSWLAGVVWSIKHCHKFCCASVPSELDVQLLGEYSKVVTNCIRLSSETLYLQIIWTHEDPSEHQMNRMCKSVTSLEHVSHILPPIVQEIHLCSAKSYLDHHHRRGSVGGLLGRSLPTPSPSPKKKKQTAAWPRLSHFVLR